MGIAGRVGSGSSARRKWSGVALCCGLAVTLARAADSDQPVVAGKLGQALEAALLESGGADFWGAVLVARKGVVLLAKGYGMADHEKTPNTPLTLFELASTSKQFTAAAILHLQQKKKLEVSHTLDRVFEDVPEDKHGITLHHLLTHRSGMSGSVGVPYASPIQREQYVKQMLAQPLAAKPGERFEYCNAGYALLAAVVEEVARTSFEEYAERWLFQPARMESTGFIGDQDLQRSGRCSARQDPNRPRSTAADWHWGWGYRGMGGVVSHVYDLLRWDRALRGDKILNEASKKILYQPALEGYACGWRVVETSGRTLVEHAGSVAGYGIHYVRGLDDDWVMVILSNDPKRVHAITQAWTKLL